MNNTKPKEHNIPLISFIIFLAPFLFLMFFLSIFKISISSKTVCLLFSFVYALFLMFFYKNAENPKKNQGYYLLTFLLISLAFIPIFLALFFGIWPKTYQPTSNVYNIFSSIVALSSLSFITYCIGIILQEVLIQVYGWFHELSFELQHNTNVLVKIQSEEVLLTSDDFTYTSFNRYLKVQMIWALISVVFFPISLNFQNLSDNSYLFSSLGYIMLILIIISIPLGFIHYRNYKKKVTFELKATRSENNIVEETRKEIKFSSDLMSFLKIGLLLGSITKMFDMINTFNTMEEDILIKVIIGVTLFFLEYSFVVINLFFIQITHNYFINSKKVKETIIRPAKKKLEVFYYPFRELKKSYYSFNMKRFAIKEKSKLFAYLFVYPISLIIDLVYFYFLMIIILLEFSLIMLTLLILFTLAFIFGIIHFPLVFIANIIIYSRIMKKKDKTTPNP